MIQPVRQTLPSMLLSLDDEPWRPSPRLLDLAASVAMMVPNIKHPILSGRAGQGPRRFAVFPGEHYHLLTAMCAFLRPATVWEFGTGGGMSTVALLEGLDPQARLYTVDSRDWSATAASWLIEHDFNSGRVTQLRCDMTSDVVFANHLENLSQAELISVNCQDLPLSKGDFLTLLERVPFRAGPIVLFDNIRLVDAVSVWRGIQHPKMDMTSFGHWTGTGLVDWRPPDPRGRPVDPGTKPMASASPTTEPASTIRPLVAAAIDAGKTTNPAARRAREAMRILLLCHPKPNYVPDLLLHGLRKLSGAAVVDFPRKDTLYDGCLGQPYLDRIDGLMAADTEVDRLEIRAKTSSGFFDLVLCDVRAISANRELLANFALIDGEDRPARIRPGNYVILRRETDGGDFSVPLPMAIPVEVLDWIDRHADAPKIHSIGFLGSRSSLTPERNAMLDKLFRTCPDAFLDTWGVSGGRWQGRDAYYRALQSCRVVLTLPGAGFDTFRYWENASCNAAHVASRMPLLIPNDFRDGLEIIRFSEVEELAAAVEGIEAGSIDWRALAERSRRWLHANHTTERRAATTLDRLNTAFLR